MHINATPMTEDPVIGTFANTNPIQQEQQHLLIGTSPIQQERRQQIRRTLSTSLGGIDTRTPYYIYRLAASYGGLRQLLTNLKNCGRQGLPGLKWGDRLCEVLETVMLQIRQHKTNPWLRDALARIRPILLDPSLDCSNQCPSDRRQHLHCSQSLSIM